MARPIFFPRSMRVMSFVVAAIVHCLPLYASSSVGSNPDSDVSDVALFYRCFSTIVGRPPERWRIQEIKNGGDPVASCVSILNSARLGSEGLLPNVSVSTLGAVPVASSADPIAVEVLNNFHRSVTSWFKYENIRHISANANEVFDPVADFVNLKVTAGHVVRAMFHPSAQVRDLVTLSWDVEEVRSQGRPSYFGISRRDSGFLLQNLSNAICGGLANAYGNSGCAAWTPQYPQFGNLLGVVDIRPSGGPSWIAAKYNTGFRLWRTPSSLSGVSGGGGEQHAIIYPYRGLEPGGAAPATANSGLGAIGSQSYLLLNDGRLSESFSNGGATVPRRLSESVFREFLCKSGPYLRNEDASPVLLTSYATTSSLAFRQQSSCLQCHAALDPMAAVFRNGVPMTGNFNREYRPLFWVSWTPNGSLPEESAPFVSTNPSSQVGDLYHRRKPWGTLHYRDSSGTKQLLQVSGPQALGAALADSNDFYECMASKVFHQFTGIQVDLNDPARATSVSEESLRHRAIVQSLGQSLRGHQSLTNIVQEILELPLYRTQDMR